MNTYLQKPDEIAQHQPINGRQTIDNIQRILRILTPRYTILIELRRYQGFMELAIPELEEGGGDVWVGAVGWWDPLVATQFQGVYLIHVTGHSVWLQIEIIYI